MSAVRTKVISVRVDRTLADEAVKVLGANSRTEAVRTALRELVGLAEFKDVMREHGGKHIFAALDERGR